MKKMTITLEVEEWASPMFSAYWEISDLKAEISTALKSINGLTIKYIDIREEEPHA